MFGIQDQRDSGIEIDSMEFDCTKQRKIELTPLPGSTTTTKQNKLCLCQEDTVLTNTRSQPAAQSEVATKMMGVELVD